MNPHNNNIVDHPNPGASTFQFTSQSPASSSHSSPSSGSTTAPSNFGYAEQISEHFSSTSTPSLQGFIVSPHPVGEYSNQQPAVISTTSPHATRHHAGIANYNEINDLLQSLRLRRINTLIELRRAERSLLRQPEFAVQYQSAMAEAWTHYVHSHNLLSELRGLTRQYPFSSALLEEAKRCVYFDRRSSASWNYAWLCLVTMQNGNLVKDYAVKTAEQQDMWGNITPTQEDMERLADVLERQWMDAVEQMLKSWNDAPPTMDWDAYQ